MPWEQNSFLSSAHMHLRGCSKPWRSQVEALQQSQIERFPYRAFHHGHSWHQGHYRPVTFYEERKRNIRKTRGPQHEYISEISSVYIYPEKKKIISVSVSVFLISVSAVFWTPESEQNRKWMRKGIQSRPKFSFSSKNLYHKSKIHTGP